MGAMTTMELVEAGLAVTAVGGEITGKGPLGSLKPRVPPPAPTVLMPDQQAITQAQQLQASKAASMRYGRAATVLTNNSNTSDKLGP